MLVHSSTMAPIAGSLAASRAPYSRMSASAAATSITSSSLRMTRVNSRPSSVPITGVAGSTPAASRWARVMEAALMVRMPTLRPGGSVAWTIGTCIRLEVATGTPTWAAISR